MVDGDYDVDDNHNNLTMIELVTIMPIITIIIMIHILHSTSCFCSGPPHTVIRQHFIAPGQSPSLCHWSTGFMYLTRGEKAGILGHFPGFVTAHKRRLYLRTVLRQMSEVEHFQLLHRPCKNHSLLVLSLQNNIAT